MERQREAANLAYTRRVFLVLCAIVAGAEQLF